MGEAFFFLGPFPPPITCQPSPGDNLKTFGGTLLRDHDAESAYFAVFFDRWGRSRKEMDLYEQVIHDWQTLNNAEPFWAKINSTDTAALARRIGFREALCGYFERSEHPATDKTTLGPKPVEPDAHPQGARAGCEVFYVMQGVK